jgi:nicotinate-nucleotide adenylyltransferase
MAQEAHAQLGLDRVVLVPVGTPPHKVAHDDPGGETRLELCRLAVGDDPRFAVSRLELDRLGPSYTVDTLREVHAASPEHELTFIVGGDNAQSLPTVWREPEAVLALATLAVAERDGVARREVARAVAGLRGAERLRFFDMPRLDVSSSAIRARVREGRPIRFLVPDAVADAIAARGLYRSEVPA